MVGGATNARMAAAAGRYTVSRLRGGMRGAKTAGRRLRVTGTGGGSDAAGGGSDAGGGGTLGPTASAAALAGAGGARTAHRQGGHAHGGRHAGKADEPAVTYAEPARTSCTPNGA